MKLKNIIKVGSFVVAGILPTVSNAQTYMCQACPAGTYSGGGTATSCTPCSAGTYSNGGASSCAQCNPGTYSDDGASQCSPCPSGKYNNSTGSGSCQDCGAGSYASGTGNSSCATCSAGSYSSAGASSCTPCKAGTFSNTSGASSCTPCSAGTYSGSDNATSCTSCAGNTSQNLTGQSSCTSCGDFTAESSSGSTKCKGKKTWGKPGDYTITLPAGKYRAILVGGASGGGSAGLFTNGQAGGCGGQLVKIFTLTRAEQFKVTVGNGGGGGHLHEGYNGTDTVLTLTSSNGETSGIIKDKPLIAEKGIGGAQDVGISAQKDDNRSGSCKYAGYGLSEGEKCYSKNEVSNNRGAVPQRDSGSVSGLADGRAGGNGAIQFEIIE